MSRKLLFSVSVLLVLGFAVVANAAIVAEYDASAVTTLRPGEDTPAWTFTGNLGEATSSDDMGDYLSLHMAGIGNEVYNAGDSGSWKSPTGTNMDLGVTDYSIVAKMQPVDDYISTGYAYEAQNIVIQWSDDTNWYAVSFDKDKNDAVAGTLGRIIRAKYGWINIVDDVDFSAARELTIAYDASDNEFDFYLEGSYAASMDPAVLAIGAVHAPYQDVVIFGDGTTGGDGPDYDSDWYYVQLHDTYVPEPATLTLLGLAGLFGIRRRRKA